MSDSEDARPHKRAKLDYGQNSASDGPSDFKLLCEGHSILVHKARLRKNSEFFEKAFTLRMKESLLGEMILQEKDIRIVKAVIYWMYFRPYDDGFANDPSVTRSREVFNAEVYALAEEWKIADLKKLAVEKVELDLGDRKPRKDCSDAIEVVYGSTPSNDRTLRDTFSAHAARFHHDLKGDEKFAERLEQVVGFGKDVFQALSGRYGRYVCPSSSCPAVFEWPVDQVGALPKCPFCQFKFYGSYRAQPAPK